MRLVLSFLLSVSILFGEPIDEDFLEDEGLAPGQLIQYPENNDGILNQLLQLSNLGAPEFESQMGTGMHMVDLHEPDNPNAQDRKLFYLDHDVPNGGLGTRVESNFETPNVALPLRMPKPEPIVSDPPPVVREKKPEPGWAASEPTKVMSNYQPVIIHHEDESNPVRRVSIHNLADHLIPYQHRPDRPELEPQEPELEQPDMAQSEGSGCQGSGEPGRGEAEIIKITEHGFHIVKPVLLDVKQQDCGTPKQMPQPQQRVRNAPLLVKPCAILAADVPCYTTAKPSPMPTTTTTRTPTLPPTTTRKPTLPPATTQEPTFAPTTTKKPTSEPTTTTKTIVIQPVIIVPDITTSKYPDVPEGCQGSQCKDKFITLGVDEKPKPVKRKPKKPPTPPKPKPVHEIHVHHFHVHDDGSGTYQKSLIVAGRNDVDDALEEEGKKMEGLSLPPCKIGQKDDENCDMASAYSSGGSPSENVAREPSAKNINEMIDHLNDNPPESAMASLETALEKQGKKERAHLKELGSSERRLDNTRTVGKAEAAGLALEKRETEREIAKTKAKLKKNKQSEAQLAEKREEAETQLALKNKETQNAIQEAYVKAAQQDMLAAQKKQGEMQDERIRSQEASLSAEIPVSPKKLVRVSSAAETHPERIIYLYVLGALVVFIMSIYYFRRCKRSTGKKPSIGGYTALQIHVEEI